MACHGPLLNGPNPSQSSELRKRECLKEDGEHDEYIEFQ
jgi:hypothetical protein